MREFTCFKDEINLKLTVDKKKFPDATGLQFKFYKTPPPASVDHMEQADGLASKVYTFTPQSAGDWYLQVNATSYHTHAPVGQPSEVVLLHCTKEHTGIDVDVVL